MRGPESQSGAAVCSLPCSQSVVTPRSRSSRNSVSASSARSSSSRAHCAGVCSTDCSASTAVRSNNLSVTGVGGRLDAADLADVLRQAVVDRPVAVLAFPWFDTPNPAVVQKLCPLVLPLLELAATAGVVDDVDDHVPYVVVGRRREVTSHSCHRHRPVTT